MADDDKIRVGLRESLLGRRSELHARLTVRLGEPDRADDALQDVYLKLHGETPLKPPQDPFAYLMRMAVNAASDSDRARRRKLGLAESAEILNAAADAAPNPETVASDRSELEALRQAIGELTERQRHILMASRLDGTPHRDIAETYRISTRTVEMELKRALEFCAERLQRKYVRRFGPKGQGSSLQ